MFKRNWKTFAVFIAVPLAVGALSAFLSREGMAAFEGLQKPTLAPPAAAFPIVWTILYILMGISAALVWLSRDRERGNAMFVFGAQLFVNFWWSIFFFRWQIRGYAFFWLLLLLGLVVWMIAAFRKIRPLAGKLNLPYLLWLCLATWLNAAVWILNR